MAAAEVHPFVPLSEHSTAPVVCKPQPLMLKDFLRQDHNSESFDRRHNLPASSRWDASAADGSDTVRYLLTLELNNNNNGAGEKKNGVTTRSPSTPGCNNGSRNNNPFARLSAVIHALKMLPSLSNSSSSVGSSPAAALTKRPQLLPRSFSKRLRRGYFWKKCGGDRQRKKPLYELASRKVFVRDIVRRASLDDDKSSSSAWRHNKADDDAHPSSFSSPPKPTFMPAKKKTDDKQTHTSTSTARSSPARASCSCSTSVSSSWLELDSDSSSSGSESVGSSSSPVPDYAKPAATPRLSGERKRASTSFDHDGNGPAAAATSPARRSVGGGVVASASPPAPTPTPTAGHHPYPPDQGTDGKEGSAMLFACSQYEDKDQLSPVAVADFPSSSDEENDEPTSQSDEQSSSSAGGGVEEDEEETEPTVQSSSSSFQQRLASIERVKHRLMWKIHKFETLADLVDPDDDDAESTAQSMVDGDRTRRDGHSIECSEDEEEEEEGDEQSTSSLLADGDVEGRARELLERLKRSCGCRRRFVIGQENKWRCEAEEHEAMLLDLFVQGLWEHDEKTRRCNGGATGRSTSMAVHCIVGDDDSKKQAVEDDLIRAARAWVEEEEEEEDEEKKGVYEKNKKKSSTVDVSTKAALIKELDKDGPWGRCLDKEEDEVALAVGDALLDSLLAELLLDMLLTPLNC